MLKRWVKLLLCCVFACIAKYGSSQIQSCPANINFSTGGLSFWSAKTGLVSGASQNYPAPNNGVTTIPEYNISSTGIRVITTSTADKYGGFSTIPVINGYAYNYSVQLGSTATSHDLNAGIPNPGGFTRAITYTINVPAGNTAVPYTMTYAYALVLENGTHNSNEQPLFKAILSTNDSIITCASPQYYLPTHNDAGSGPGSGSTGATLDTAAALSNGFTLSPVFFLSYAGQNNTNGTLLRDVWTKGWTEVTFDLSPYRGQQVTLTFEADNCAPGAHFAYAYVALRNTCAGLEISGNTMACTNSSLNYSIPALAGATYNWTVPAGWTINSGANTNTINITAGTTGGYIIANEKNGCANLKDTIIVTTSAPTVAGKVNSDNTVCIGSNSTLLTLTGETGGVLNWLSSTDGVNWTTIAATSDSYTAQNVEATTQYKAVVQNSFVCNIDTSAAAIITVDPKSVGGVLNPTDINICAGQNTNNTLTLSGNTGPVVNWQRSNDNTNWSNFNPVKRDSTYTAGAVNATTYYRTIIKSGVCPADTGAIATINFINVPYPAATINPDSSSICYGRSSSLDAMITTGTNYTWSNSDLLTNEGNGVVSSLPYPINATATPPVTTDFVLTVYNAGCPNPSTDTFHVEVTQPIIVFAGNDTSVVINQPLQFNTIVNEPAADNFTWTPATGLNLTTIPNPVAMYGANSAESITYVVKAETAVGCTGFDTITVTIFKTGADIFMPSAFTPNGDGRNDYIRPICVGIKQLSFFKIYNRWGQLIFSTSEIGKGWDGAIRGKPQSTDNFVYMVQGVDYTGKVIFKKGNVLLVR